MKIFENLETSRIIRKISDEVYKLIINEIYYIYGKIIKGIDLESYIKSINERFLVALPINNNEVIKSTLGDIGDYAIMLKVVNLPYNKDIELGITNNKYIIFNIDKKSFYRLFKSCEDKNWYDSIDDELYNIDFKNTLTHEIAHFYDLKTENIYKKKIGAKVKNIDYEKNDAEIHAFINEQFHVIDSFIYLFDLQKIYKIIFNRLKSNFRYIDKKTKIKFTKALYDYYIETLQDIKNTNYEKIIFVLNTPSILNNFYFGEDEDIAFNVDLMKTFNKDKYLYFLSNLMKQYSKKYTKDYELYSTKDIINKSIQIMHKNMEIPTINALIKNDMLCLNNLYHYSDHNFNRIYSILRRITSLTDEEIKRII